MRFWMVGGRVGLFIRWVREAAVLDEMVRVGAWVSACSTLSSRSVGRSISQFTVGLMGRIKTEAYMYVHRQTRIFLVIQPCLFDSSPQTCIFGTLARDGAGLSSSSPLSDV